MNQLLCGREARRRVFSTLTRLRKQIAAHNERFLVVKFSMRTSTGVSVGQGARSCATNRNRTAVCCLLNRRRNCRMRVFRKPSAILVVCGPVPTIATMSALDRTWVGDAGIQQSRRYWRTHPHGLFQTSKTFRPAFREHDGGLTKLAGHSGAPPGKRTERTNAHSTQPKRRFNFNFDREQIRIGCLSLVMSSLCCCIISSALLLLTPSPSFP